MTNDTPERIAPDPQALVAGTSFHGDYIKATRAQIEAAIGPAHFTARGDKVNFEWGFSTDTGPIGTLYDYKEDTVDPDALIDWHVGARNRSESADLKAWLVSKIYLTKN